MNRPSISPAIIRYSIVWGIAIICFLFLIPFFATHRAPALLGTFHDYQASAPLVFDAYHDDNVLGEETANDTKHIEVDLTNQKVYTYDGTVRLNEYTVSTGKWGVTPRGEFTIARKVRSQTMSGGNKSLGTYYHLPNVQWVQYFGNKEIPWSRGFSFHSTYWHDNFGHPMSHGCINMKTADAKALYDWAAPGTRVVIYGVTPTS